MYTIYSPDKQQLDKDYPTTKYYNKENINEIFIIPGSINFLDRNRTAKKIILFI
jgi:hypothetical protein